MRARSNIRRVNPALGAFFLAFLGACRVLAVDADPNPYSVIIEKNAFRLTPLPPPAPPTAETLGLPTVFFSGTETIGGQVRALLAVMPADSKKNDPGAPERKETTSYLVLSEGQSEGSLQLVKIHPDQEAIDIIISGTSMTLTMKNNGFAKTASNAPPAPAPKLVGQRPGGPGTAAVPTTQGRSGALAAGASMGLIAGGNRVGAGNSGDLIAGGSALGGIIQNPANGAAGNSSPSSPSSLSSQPGNGANSRQLGASLGGGYQNSIANGTAGGNGGTLVGGAIGSGEAASGAPDPGVNPVVPGYVDGMDGVDYMNGKRELWIVPGAFGM
jgi:hypothetical protein